MAKKWAYWGRVVFAFALLKLASRVMKDAENLLGVTREVRELSDEEPVAEVTGNNGDGRTVVEHIEEWVEPSHG